LGESGERGDVFLFGQDPYRAQVMKRLEQLYNYPKYVQPFRRGSLYFFSKNDGLQNQNVFYVQTGLEGAPELLLDPTSFRRMAPRGYMR